MTLLAVDWASIGIKTLQLILSLSILVSLHELGHYATAKWFKCRVEKFYLFFDPWFSIWKKKIGETVYGIGWIPFGGYVKISGMVDESMDKEQLKQPAKSYEFRSKPAWQRLIIMVAGVFMNVLLAIVIFVSITWAWGDKYIPVENLKFGVYADTLGTKIGLHDGDIIIAVDNEKIERVGTVGSEIIINEAKSITVDRNGEKINLKLPPGFIGQLNKNRLEGFSYVRFPLVIDSILPKAKIKSGSLVKGDSLIAFNNAPVHFNIDYIKLTKDYKSKDGVLTVVRNGKDTLKSTVFFDAEGNNDIGFKGSDKILGIKQVDYSFFEAIPAGFNRCWETLDKYVRNLKLLFTSSEVKVSDSLGSVISIGNAFSGVWDWQSFWTLTAIFSILLAFMNILPIPALDGGHALFCLYEMITGKKPTDKFMEYAQMVGMVLLLGLMAYALGLDIFRLFK
jgi:regulator of sigma E protease